MHRCYLFIEIENGINSKMIIKVGELTVDKKENNQRKVVGGYQKV